MATNKEESLATIASTEAERCRTEAMMLEKEALEWDLAAWWLLHPEQRAANTSYFGEPAKVRSARTIRENERTAHATV